MDLRTLPYGTVARGFGELVIGIESLPHVSPVQRTLFEQAVAAAGVDPDDVLVVRITEAGVQVALIEPDERWPCESCPAPAAAPAEQQADPARAVTGPTPGRFVTTVHAGRSPTLTVTRAMGPLGRPQPAHRGGYDS